jgi:trimethylguanosine synthase
MHFLYLVIADQVGDGKHLDAQEQDYCSELHYLSKIPDEEPINHR